MCVDSSLRKGSERLHSGRRGPGRPASGTGLPCFFLPDCRWGLLCQGKRTGRIHRTVARVLFVSVVANNGEKMFLGAGNTCAGPGSSSCPYGLAVARSRPRAETHAPGVARRARQPIGSRAGPGKHVTPVQVAASHYAVRQPVGLSTVVSTWAFNIPGLTQSGPGLC